MFDRNAIDPFEGIETSKPHPKSSLISFYRNAIDPFEGIETYILPGIMAASVYRNAIDPFEGIETYFAQHAYALQCIALHRNAIDPFEGILAAPVYRFAIEGAAHV